MCILKLGLADFIASRSICCDRVMLIISLEILSQNFRFPHWYYGPKLKVR
jgi:hypothetical protein